MEGKLGRGIMESLSGVEHGQMMEEESAPEDEEMAEILGKLVLKLAQACFLLNLAFFLPN